MFLKENILNNFAYPLHRTVCNMSNCLSAQCLSQSLSKYDARFVELPRALCNADGLPEKGQKSTEATVSKVSILKHSFRNYLSPSNL
jgi:hypothetical protein